ncbi:MAG TPA: ComEC/Rec2 family competence protein [Candidatus Paceibacterota bacterium]
MTTRVFWTLVVGFLVGVFARSLVPISSAFSLLLVVMSVTSIALVIISREKRTTGILVAVALISIALGIWRTEVATLKGDSFLSAHLGEQLIVEGKVAAEPDVREGSVRLIVNTDTIIYNGATSTLENVVGVLVVAPPHTDVTYGDSIRAVGIIRAPERFDTGEGRQFAYPEYLAMRGVFYELSRAQIEWREEHTGNPVQALAISIKHAFLEGLGAALPEPAAGFAGGITVGDKRSIGQELSEDFQTVGLIHMVVLSGYNITIVLNAAAWLIKRAPLLKHMRFAPMGVSGMIVMLFVLMSGGASSGARAGAMALIGVYARTSGRIFLASRALAVAVLAIVLWNPLTLAFDPGFQFSVLATLGLIVFTPLFAEKLTWVPEKFLLREIAASTLGTQLAVLPLLLYQNGQLPIYALPANLITLVFIPLAMLFSLIAGIAGIFLGPLAIPVGFPAYLLLEYIISAAQIIADLPYASISIGAFNAVWMIIAYAIIFLIATRLHGNKKRPDVM